jgi:2,4-dienoyl-CoA reductase-like NADH-dependent reductase (Old Yellow Enzyme family)
MIGVRLSIFDAPPFKPDATRGTAGKLGPGIPEEFRHLIPYHYGFGCNPQNPLEMDLTEPIALVQMLRQMGVRMINASACSPYYNPHFQRPAIFPPSDGYQPPEDPLAGVARQVAVTAELAARHPSLAIVGGGCSYAQDWVAHVAQAVVAGGGASMVGLGRMMLSYPTLAADVLAGRPLDRRLVCRTFSDCTTAPRAGLVSGCFPIDPFYKEHPQRVQLTQAKKTVRTTLG